MGKLVVLKLGDGSFDQGFSITLQIGDDERQPSLETVGKLPPIPDIPQCYSDWANTYRHLGLRSRLEAPAAQKTNVSQFEICYHAADILRERLNTWLYSESFRPIRDKLLEQLSPSDEIRFIIQTEDIWLRRLPWHLWNFCDRYPKAEIALSPRSFPPTTPHSSTHSQVKILAILGNSTGINIQADRLLLEQLPDAEVHFLVEPQRYELSEKLWTQDWDILFFAGHSFSHCNDQIGRIYLNQTDSLTFDQLNYAVTRAVEKGLKIAIFNSCDGLGLAQNLAQLKIPQIVVMREPVPDRVSQEFLKYFLNAFSGGQSFYLAVREARERLQGLEDQFPCATWLPMIFQHPAIVPPTWQQLYHRESPPLSPPPPPPDPLFPRSSRRATFLLSVGITSIVLGLRHLGMLQPLELRTYDHMMQNRPAEPPDSRLLVVTVTEEDIQAQNNEPRRGSLSDRTLTRLLTKLESYQPRVIGLDLYRDFPVETNYPELAKYFKESKNFIALCKASTDKSDSAIAPPPEVAATNLGFSDLVIDRNGIVRRHLLAMTPTPTSSCTTQYALSTQLAVRYLEAKGIQYQETPEGLLKLGKVVFKPLKPHSSGYQGIDAWGHQVLLNYRFYRSAQDFAPQVTVAQVLNSQLHPEYVKDRVVLIGVTAESAKDFFPTPYGEQIPGVVVHAQQVSQMLSAVLEGRPLLWVWPRWGEALWIWGWSLIGGLIAWRFIRWQRWLLVAGAIAILSGLSFVIFLWGGWVPFVPAALVLASTGGGVAYITWQNRRNFFYTDS